MCPGCVSAWTGCLRVIVPSLQMKAKGPDFHLSSFLCDAKTRLDFSATPGRYAQLEIAMIPLLAGVRLEGQAGTGALHHHARQAYQELAVAADAGTDAWLPVFCENAARDRLAR